MTTHKNKEIGWDQDARGGNAKGTNNQRGNKDQEVGIECLQDKTGTLRNTGLPRLTSGRRRTIEDERRL